MEALCPLCGGNSKQIAIQENGYDGRKCPKCSLIFIFPRPQTKEVVNRYAENLKQAISHVSAYAGKRHAAKHHLRTIKNYIRKGSLLEIGAGSGTFLDEAKGQGFDVYGVEANKILAEYISKQLGIPCEDRTLSQLSFGNKQFDIIYHRDVLSHFSDPVSEFEKIYSKLRKDGLLVFETGNTGDIEKKYYKWFSTFQYPDHLFFFSDASLGLLLRRTGFEIRAVFRYSILPELAVARALLPRDKNKTQTSHPNKPREKSLIAGIASVGFSLIDFIACYKIGSFMPKIGRPQTIIIVAQKGYEESINTGQCP